MRLTNGARVAEASPAGNRPSGATPKDAKRATNGKAAQ
jgi:hypothetical protein